MKLNIKENSFQNMINEDYPEFAKKMNTEFGLKLEHTEISVKKRPIIVKNKDRIQYYSHSFYMNFEDENYNEFIIRVSDHKTDNVSYTHLYSIESANGQFCINSVIKEEIKRRLKYYYYLKSLPEGTLLRTDLEYPIVIESENICSFKYTRKNQFNNFQ